MEPRGQVNDPVALGGESRNPGNQPRARFLGIASAITLTVVLWISDLACSFAGYWVQPSRNGGILVRDDSRLLGAHLLCFLVVYWIFLWRAMARSSPDAIAGRAVSLSVFTYLYYLLASTLLILVSGVLWKELPAGPTTLILLILFPVTGVIAVAIAGIGAAAICLGRGVRPFVKAKESEESGASERPC